MVKKFVHYSQTQIRFTSGAANEALSIMSATVTPRRTLRRYSTATEASKTYQITPSPCRGASVLLRGALPPLRRGLGAPGQMIADLGVLVPASWSRKAVTFGLVNRFESLVFGAVLDFSWCATTMVSLSITGFGRGTEGQKIHHHTKHLV